MQYGAVFQQIEIRQRSRTRRRSAGTVTDFGVCSGQAGAVDGSTAGLHLRRWL
jgi:hypothetical protein